MAAWHRSAEVAAALKAAGPDLKPKMLRNEIGPAVAGLARKITLALAGRSI